MRILVADTETTGFPSFGKPLDDPRQPRLLQVGVLVLDTETGTIDPEFESYIWWGDDFVVPARITLINGVTTEALLREGRELLPVMSYVHSLAATCART